MKHVFVETNFLIDLLRPFPSKDAEALFARNDGVNLRRWLADRTLFDKGEVEKVRDLANADRATALSTLQQRIQHAVAAMERIDPTPAVVARTLQVFTVKSLKPFDEMVLGAVLSKATELYTAGERDLHFCDLDGDLASKHPPLLAVYASCGLAVHQDFLVP